MSERIRTFAPGGKVAIEVGFTYEGDREIETVEAVFVREGTGEEIVFLGDAREDFPREGREVRYAARLEARVRHDASPGEYRCARLSAYDRLDDDWDFTDASGLDLIIRVQRAPHQLKVTASEFV